MPDQRLGYRVRLEDRVTTVVPEWFLSLTIDTSVLIGGRWWGSSRGTRNGLSLDRTPPLDLRAPELALWAQPLAPARLRIGGTEADQIRYGFRHDGLPDAVDAQPETFVLKGRLWKDLHHWVRRVGFDVLFTVSAGPEARDEDGQWQSQAAERLLRHTIRKGHPVAAWEFGNEVNAYPFLYGLKHNVSARQYALDFARFADLVRRLAPGTRTVGPASAVWPIIGEAHPIIPHFAQSPAAAFLDVLSFHYYPQQSSRGRVAVRRARPSTLFSARQLDGVLRWVRHARRALEGGPAERAQLWVTEAGHALYGGEPGLSDTWLSTPWWLDHLGLLAHAGVQAVFRQSLVGGDYGLLDARDFSPRPDYWASLLWKRSMGRLVHARPSVEGPDRKLRAWHHSHADGTGCLLVINLHRKKTVVVDLPPVASGVLRLETDGALTSKGVRLNGTPLIGHDGLARARQSDPEPVGRELTLAPLACAFVHLRA